MPGTFLPLVLLLPSRRCEHASYQPHRTGGPAMNLTRRDALSLGLLGATAFSSCQRWGETKIDPPWEGCPKVDKELAGFIVTCVKISDTKNPGFMPLATPPSAPTTRPRSARRTRPSRRPAPCSRLSSGGACGCRGLYEADHGEPRLLARGRRAVVVHLAFEGREEGLCYRVAVAAAGATARGPHVVFPGPRRSGPEVCWLLRSLWKMVPSAT